MELSHFVYDYALFIVCFHYAEFNLNIDLGLTITEISWQSNKNSHTKRLNYVVDLLLSNPVEYYVLMKKYQF